MSASESENETMFQCTPPDVREAAEEASKNLLPSKSKENYETTYDTFNKWKQSNGALSSSETVLLAYFHELSQKYKPSSLWSFYSMLKSMINLREKIDVSKYNQLVAFMKRNSKGYQSKKSKVFSSDEIQKFLTEASDHEYLATKVVLIFGVYGACRGDELVKIRVQDISTQGDLLLVVLPDTKTSNSRSFAIGPDLTGYVKKYQGLRPKNTSSNRFFVNYQQGKCSNQVIGKNKIASLPKQIANYLELPNSEMYTGHCFRRTSATIVADKGANITTLKRHGGWKSSSVAEGYIEDSVQSKAKIENLISSSINLPADKSNEIPELLSKRQKLNNEENPQQSTSKDNSVKDNKIFKFENCSITFNFTDN